MAHGKTFIDSVAHFFVSLMTNALPDWSHWEKFGYNPAVGSSEELLWTQGGDYTVMSTATTLYISSSSGTDTDVDVEVLGLDADGLEQIQEVNTGGQSQVAIPGTWLGVVNRARVSGATASVGDLYIAETDTLSGGVPTTVSKIKAKLAILDQITMQSIFMIPANKIGYILEWEFSTGKTSDTRARLVAQDDGGVEHTHNSANVFENRYCKRWKTPAEQQPLTLIKIMVSSANPSPEVSGGFDIVIVES